MGLPISRAMVVAVLMVTLSGCALSGRAERQAAQQARNDVAVTAIRGELSQVPGVVEAHVTYGADITNTGSTGVSLIVRKGTDFERINDLAVRTVWRSNLNPVGAISVSVLQDEDRTQGIGHDYNEFDDWGELEARYGPRLVAGG